MAGENEKYTLLRVRTDRIEANGRRIIADCAAHGVVPWCVSKGISAPREVALAFKSAGFETIADSRLDNIRKMRDGGVQSKFALIRIPMYSELCEAAELCDCVLVSDAGVTAELARICEEKRKKICAVVMFDMGDLREGWWYEDAAGAARAFAALEGRFLRVAGVGANFSCASGVLPSVKNLQDLAECGHALEAELGRGLEIYSGGGTCSFVEMRRGHLPREFNNLRLGEGILLGRDTAFNMIIDGLSQDTMQLEAELVEVRPKRTTPVGEVGRDAFGGVPSFTDRGVRRQGILAVGRQDVNIAGLTPLDGGVYIKTASSDHLLVDIEARPDLKTGDILKFRPDYPAMLSASTSRYVAKIFENGDQSSRTERLTSTV